MKMRTLLFMAAALQLSGKSSTTSSLQSQTQTPPPVYSFAAAYDEDRQRLVLFGGFASGVYYGDTWEWDGVNWRRVSQTGPSPRNAPAMTYDSRRKKIVLFGGDDRSGALRDTWEWDGQQWQQTATSGPSARTLHALVYDGRRRKTVLIGGLSGNTPLGETWEWDGQQWMQANAGPSPRYLHAAAYDTASGKVFVFSGATEPPPQPAIHPDLWEWDGAAWRFTTSLGPSARDHHAMAYDAARKKLVLFGGTENGDFLGDTWEWDGQRWLQMSIAGPIPRAGHKLVFDSQRNKVILYGGFAAFGPTTELWEWNGISWQMIQVTSVHHRDDQPQDFQLMQNYPNPLQASAFNPATTIGFRLSAPHLVNLKVYDMLGQEVATVLNERRSAGAHEVKFDAAELPAGFYLYRLQIGSFVATRKLLLLR